MGPQRCSGYTEAGISYGCRFNPASKGGKAIAKKNGQCMVCSPSLMGHMCSSGLLRGSLIYHLSRIRNQCPDLFQDALRRVPLEWQCVVARAVGDGDAKKQKKAHKKAKKVDMDEHHEENKKRKIKEIGVAKQLDNAKCTGSSAAASGAGLSAGGVATNITLGEGNAEAEGPMPMDTRIEAAPAAGEAIVQRGGFVDESKTEQDADAERKADAMS